MSRYSRHILYSFIYYAVLAPARALWRQWTTILYSSSFHFLCFAQLTGTDPDHNGMPSHPIWIQIFVQPLGVMQVSGIEWGFQSGYRSELCCTCVHIWLGVVALCHSREVASCPWIFTSFVFFYCKSKTECTITRIVTCIFGGKMQEKLWW